MKFSIYLLALSTITLMACGIKSRPIAPKNSAIPSYVEEYTKPEKK